MADFIDLLRGRFSDTINMTIFSIFKSGNPVFDTIFSTVILSIFGYTVNYLYEKGFNINFLKCDIKTFFYKKNKIILEGNKNYVSNPYTMNYTISSNYSDRFKAIWNYIIENINENKTIYEIKECHTNNYKYDTQPSAIFLVSQDRHFTIDEYIYFETFKDIETGKNETEKMDTKTEKITIVIYSYNYSLLYLKNYIDTITTNYLITIKNARINKKFIYTLEKIKYDECIRECWSECVFESSKTFNNIFFDGKLELIEKVRFFINNRQWYFDSGIPYTLGIGLHGLPGTGKTSFIKALANDTGRHMIVLSLKTIKTRSDLNKFFFETRYNTDNEKNSITFDNKIIVIEDIDCIGDIILKRDSKKSTKKCGSKTNSNILDINTVLKNIITDDRDSDTDKKSNIISFKEDDPITLDDILNLWDGIRETPGRILVISSNHYDRLDPALIRPGRIDITHEFSNASHKTIQEIHKYYFKNEISTKNLKKINEYFYSPAEIVNIYLSNKDEKSFINRLMKNKNV